MAPEALQKRQPAFSQARTVAVLTFDFNIKGAGTAAVAGAELHRADGPTPVVFHLETRKAKAAAGDTLVLALDPDA